MNLWTIVIGALKLVIAGVDALLPDWTPLDLTEHLAGIVAFLGDVKIGQFLGWVNLYAPISEAIDIARIALPIWMTALIYRGVLKLLRSLRVLGAGS